MEDGGAGFNIDLIKSKALALGIDIQKFKNPIDLVTLSEFSTSSSITRRSGRGVGMSAVKSIVDSYHGTIDLENREDGKGSRITIKLPARRVMSGGAANDWAA